MAFKNRVGSMCLLSSFSTLCFLVGCGKSAQPPAEQGKQAASFLSSQRNIFVPSLLGIRHLRPHVTLRKTNKGG